jgi:hypothetical protein
MKIILEAFGYLSSEPMDVPENTTPNFKLALRQPIQAITGYDGRNTGNIPPLATIAEFEWTGKYASIGDDVKEWPRIYVLRDIYKQ